MPISLTIPQNAMLYKLYNLQNIKSSLSGRRTPT